LAEYAERRAAVCTVDTVKPKTPSSNGGVVDFKRGEDLGEDEEVQMNLRTLVFGEGPNQLVHAG
jgi:hypothetical protein